MPKLRTFFSVVGFNIVIGSLGAAAPTSETAVNDGFTFGVCRVELFTRADPPYAQLLIRKSTANFAYLWVDADEAVGWTANDITKIRDNCGVSGDALAFTDPTGNYYDTGSFGITYTTEAEGAVFAGYDISDTTAPTFDVAPSVGSVTSSGFTPSASIDEAGKIYYVVVADGATAPSAAQVKAGADYSGVTVLAAANATVSSSPFTSSFSAITSLSDNTAYDVYFIAEDGEGTPNLQSSVTKVDTTTLDATAPTLSSSSPSDNATGVAVGANIVLTFNENVQAGTGNIVISDGASDTRTIAIGGGQVSISGAVVTINPTANLSSSTTYYVQVASTAVEDTSGNAYSGISDTTTLNFTTVDTTAPTATFSPANGATDVAVDANITITFDEAIRLVDDSALTNSNVDALITLKETNSSGSNIAFDATISGNVITAARRSPQAPQSLEATNTMPMSSVQSLPSTTARQSLVRCSSRAAPMVWSMTRSHWMQARYQ